MPALRLRADHTCQLDHESLQATVSHGSPGELWGAGRDAVCAWHRSGSNPLDAGELSYVSERAGLRTLPTMASMIIPDTIVAQSGVECARSCIGRVPGNIPAVTVLGELLVNQRVVSVFDRGGAGGAEIELETELRLARDDTVVCTAGSRVIARGDGGFGGPSTPVRSRHRMPNRDPDLVCGMATRPDQALLFRLCGDLNPLHADPKIARQAGFDAPILHGRCTYGIACHAILKTVCDTTSR